MHRRGWSPGTVALLVVLAALGLGAAVVGVVAAPGVVRGAADSSSPTDGPDRPPGPPAPTSGPADPEPSRPARAADPSGRSVSTTSVAREVLREWDRRREAAWVAADADALAALYVPGAAAGRRDVDLLRRWHARGAEITRLQPQVLDLRVVDERPRRLVLRVTDRLALVGATVAGRPVDLPTDAPTARLIELRRGARTTSAWRVASVRVSP